MLVIVITNIQLWRKSALIHVIICKGFQIFKGMSVKCSENRYTTGALCMLLRKLCSSTIEYLCILDCDYKFYLSNYMKSVRVIFFYTGDKKKSPQTELVWDHQFIFLRQHFFSYVLPTEHILWICGFLRTTPAYLVIGLGKITHSDHYQVTFTCSETTSK